MELTSDYLEVSHVSGIILYLEVYFIRMSGCPDILISGYPDNVIRSIEIRRYPDNVIRISDILDDMQACMYLEVQQYTMSGCTSKYFFSTMSCVCISGP